MNVERRKFDLGNRLIESALLIIEIRENGLKTRAGNNVSGQLVSSATSPTLHYGEA